MAAMRRAFYNEARAASGKGLGRKRTGFMGALRVVGVEQAEEIRPASSALQVFSAQMELGGRQCSVDVGCWGTQTVLC